MIKEKSKKFGEETKLAEILKHPQGVKILVKHNIPCFGCPLDS